MRTPLRALFLGIALLPACKRQDRTLPPIVIDVRDRAAEHPLAPTPPAPAAAPPPATLAVNPGQAHPPVCEVEMFGDVKYKGQPVTRGRLKGGTPMVYVADNDCLGKNVHTIGHIAVTDQGRFFVEMFSKWGADLTICAALEPAEGKPARIYGKAAGPHHAEAMGEVLFKDVLIEMKDGPPRVFPRAVPPR